MSGATPFYCPVKLRFCVRSNSCIVVRFRPIFAYFSDKLAKETDENEKLLIIQSIQNGSIVHWQHINFYGEYDFTGIETNKREFEFNLDKIIQFKLEDN
ncbi:MAG: hypothetical protein PHZ10_06850 [Aliarcobacter cryaerophilus]|nr:hypothetical protein [Aliarcobacter cryaerophilus]